MFNTKNIESFINEKSATINACTDYAAYNGIMADISAALDYIAEKCADPFSPGYFRTLFDILNEIATEGV